mmetsp:Transcript_31404/g.40246  ORF Transcript_31404/g.40246 Transcript_31404/m.40246 type:complete len:360 (+) Transcript_31404:76-1155(+)
MEQKKIFSLVPPLEVLINHLDSPSEHFQAKEFLSGLKVDTSSAFPILEPKKMAVLEERRSKNSQWHHRYLRALTLHAGLEEAVASVALNESGEAQEVINLRARAQSEQLLRSHSLLPPRSSGNQGQGQGFLGLCPQDLCSKIKKYTDEVGTETFLSSRVEEILKDRAFSVARFLYPQALDPECSSGSAAACSHIANIPNRIKEIQSSTKLEQVQLSEILVESDKCLWENLKITLQKFQILLHLASLKLKDQALIDQTRIEHLQAWFNAISAKVKVITAQVELKTYTSTTVPALINIRSLLDSRLEGLKTDIAKVQAMLLQYDCAGPEMRTLASEYADVLQKIEEKESYLARLNRDNISY